MEWWTSQEAAVLAARCHGNLEVVARRGGPSVDDHLEELRRWLVRRSRPWGRSRGRHVALAVAIARSGQPRPLSEQDLPVVVGQLRVLDRALQRGADVGQRALSSAPA
jgi:hypothetical protein